MMSWSFNFFIHIVVFGLTSAVVVASFVIHIQILKEKVWERRLLLSGLMRIFSRFVPINAVLLLVTGYGNMVNRYGMNVPWPLEHWLATKVGLFAVLAFNGLILGPKLGLKRSTLIKSVIDGNGPADADELLVGQNASITNLFVAQIVLLTAILFLSVFGSAKHPGLF